jgi:hypothetical protein
LSDQSGGDLCFVVAALLMMSPQSASGKQLRSAPAPKHCGPLQLDRNDDNDNRLFGVTAQIDWTPKPAYQLTVRTPLYAIRN